MPKKIASHQGKHFSLLGFEALSKGPVMCCVVLSRVNQNSKIEAGLDFDKEVTGDVEDPRLFKSNFGEGKAFPDGPSCFFSGNQVPCFARWHEKGG